MAQLKFSSIRLSSFRSSSGIDEVQQVVQFRNRGTTNSAGTLHDELEPRQLLQSRTRCHPVLDERTFSSLHARYEVAKQMQERCMTLYDELQARCMMSWSRGSCWSRAPTRTAQKTTWCSGPMTPQTPGCDPWSLHFLPIIVLDVELTHLSLSSPSIRVPLCCWLATAERTALLAFSLPVDLPSSSTRQRQEHRHASGLAA